MTRTYKLVAIIAVVFLAGTVVMSQPVRQATAANPTLTDIFNIVTDIQNKVNSLVTTVVGINSATTAIKAKTDNLPSDPASNTAVNSRASQASIDQINKRIDILNGTLLDISGTIDQIMIPAIPIHQIIISNTGSSNLQTLNSNLLSVFFPGKTYPTANGAFSAAVGDFNGDGNIDLVTSPDFNKNVGVYLGTKFATYGAPTNYTIGVNGPDTDGVAVGDFNNDAKLDIVTGTGNGHTIVVLLGLGNGAFGPPVTTNTSQRPYHLAVGDLNGDGNLDLVTSCLCKPGSVTIELGTGFGTFTGGETYSVGDDPDAMALGDFNGDGKPDIAVNNEQSTFVSVLIGQGNGNFSPATNYQLLGTGLGIGVGDFNGDGFLDIVTGSGLANQVAVLPGKGNGVFGSLIVSVVGKGVFALAVSDFNLDGKPDIVTTDTVSQTAAVALGTGNGKFGPSQLFSTGNQPYAVTVVY